jgi:hypothetical protein
VRYPEVSDELQRFVSGHDFSRAAENSNEDGFSRCTLFAEPKAKNKSSCIGTSKDVP